MINHIRSLKVSWNIVGFTGAISFVLSFIIYTQLLNLFSEKVGISNSPQIVVFYYLFGTSALIACSFWILSATLGTFFTGLKNIAKDNLFNIFSNSFFTFCATALLSFLAGIIYLIVVGTLARPYFF